MPTIDLSVEPFHSCSTRVFGLFARPPASSSFPCMCALKTCPLTWSLVPATSEMKGIFVASTSSSSPSSLFRGFFFSEKRRKMKIGSGERENAAGISTENRVTSDRTHRCRRPRAKKTNIRCATFSQKRDAISGLFVRNRGGIKL